MAQVTAGPTARRVVVVRAVFYGGLGLLLLGALVPFWDVVLPAPVAARLGRNTEGYLVALLLAAWIEFVRPRVQGTRAAVAAPLVAAVFGLLVAIGLLSSGWPSRVVTLNEAVLAVGLLTIYVAPRRPPGRRLVAPVVLLVLAVVLVGGERVAVITDQAEALGALLLVPLTLDVVDRAVLDPSAPTSWITRYAWYALLVLAPVALSVLQYQVGVSGLLEQPVRFGVRIAEAFIACLLLSGYFAVARGMTGPPRSAGGAAG